MVRTIYSTVCVRRCMQNRCRKTFLPAVRRASCGRNRKFAELTRAMVVHLSRARRARAPRTDQTHHHRRRVYVYGFCIKSCMHLPHAAAAHTNALRQFVRACIGLHSKWRVPIRNLCAGCRGTRACRSLLSRLWPRRREYIRSTCETCDETVFLFVETLLRSAKRHGMCYFVCDCAVSYTVFF